MTKIEQKPRDFGSPEEDHGDAQRAARSLQGLQAPKPLPPGDAPLTPALAAAVERIAERLHASWIAQRTADGWTLGPRNDEKKHHPCLVGYAELPDEERTYDRLMATETIHALLAMGFRIVAPDER